MGQFWKQIIFIKKDSKKFKKVLKERKFLNKWKIKIKKLSEHTKIKKL